MEPENKTQTASARSVGKLLQSTREQKHLTIDEVSSRLRLSPMQIERLEADDFAALGAPVFARGYLRNYAKLLDLSEQDVMELYEPKAEPEHIVRNSHPDQARQPERGFPLERLIFLGLIAGLLYYGYQFLPWQQWFGNDINLGNEVSETSTMTVSVPSRSTGATTNSGTAALTGAESSVTSSISVTAPDLPVIESETISVGEGETLVDIPSPAVSASVSPILPENVRSTLTATDDLLRGITETTSPVGGMLYAGDGTRIDSLNPSDLVGLNPDIVPQVTPGKNIELQFSANCWVEIETEAGERLIVGEMKAGTTRKIKTLEKIKFLLGNPKAVKILVNGKPLDTEVYQKPTRSGVVRFEL